jgi:hypothetical protein
MQRMGPTNHGTRRFPGPLGGGGLLLLYLFTATPLAPVVFSLFAGLDRSHHVAIQRTSIGLQVLLRHGCADLSSHRHGMLARALTVFAQRAAAPQSDHVIQFGSTDTVQQTPAFKIERALNLPDSQGISPNDSAFSLGDQTFVAAAAPRPPPANIGLILLLRSTVLLI